MKVSFRYRFEAAHRFVNAESPNCQTPHGHSWHVTVVLAAKNPQLNGDQMVVEFQKLKGQWKNFVQEHLDHSYFYNTNDPTVQSMREHIPGFRGFELPDDPTTETLALCFLKKAENLIDHNDVTVQSIRLEETPVNCVEVSSEDPIYKNSRFLDRDSAWWNTNQLEDRTLNSSPSQ